TEVGLDKAAFDRLDTNHDGELDAAELALWPRQTPDVEVLLELGGKSRSPSLTRLSSTKDPAHGDTLLRLSDTRIELIRNGQPPLTPQDLRKFYGDRFRELDTNRDGYLDSSEVQRPPFLFAAL